MNGTKGKMAEAFKELVCKKSFQKITISDIAKESAMTRENFYYHFRDKYDIMHWIFEQQVAAQLPEDEVPFEMWFNALFCNTCEDYKYYRKLIKTMIQRVLLALSTREYNMPHICYALLPKSQRILGGFPMK